MPIPSEISIRFSQKKAKKNNFDKTYLHCRQSNCSSFFDELLLTVMWNYLESLCTMNVHTIKHTNVCSLFLWFRFAWIRSTKSKYVINGLPAPHSTRFFFLHFELFTLFLVNLWCRTEHRNCELNFVLLVFLWNTGSIIFFIYRFHEIFFFDLLCRKCFSYAMHFHFSMISHCLIRLYVETWNMWNFHGIH